MTDIVELFNKRGTTSIYIDARIEDSGDLRFSGQDIGEAPEQIFGKDDYEYWLTVPAAEKDRLLLALIEKIYRGKASVVSEMREFLDERNIPYGFQTY